jgi:hypothetical protein
VFLGNVLRVTRTNWSRLPVIPTPIIVARESETLPGRALLPDLRMDPLQITLFESGKWEDL